MLLDQQSANELGLYDRPRIFQPKVQESTQSKLKLIFETDLQNTGLITNPHSMRSLIRVNKFVELEHSQQVTVLDILCEALRNYSNNCHILADCASSYSTALRHNQAVIHILQQGKLPDLSEPLGCPQDVLFQLLLIGLNFDHPQVLEAIKLIGCGSPSFERIHVELIYQYVRVDPAKSLSRALALLKILFDQTPLPQSYFYFNGFLSGILLNQGKQLQLWPFNKGFAACMWFNISAFMSAGKMQDPQNLPVLFNCYSQGFGGFECYFNQNKLYYRILPPIAYTPPTVDSNGFLVSEFQANKWYYLAIEHDKPFLARAQLIAVVNDKQVVNFSMDYPKFDKVSKLSQVCICNNFIGQMSNFVLFKEQINNPQKFVQIYKHHTPDFKSFDQNIFEQRLQEKILLMYSPHRTNQKTATNQKTVYDCIDMNDGELLINCGVWGYSQTIQRSLIQEQGGIQSLLAVLDKCTQPDEVNQFLKILTMLLASENSNQCKIGNFFQLFFAVINNLPHAAVNCQTVQLLTELRFTVQDKNQSEIFFYNLLMSADFWISTENIEIMQEYWSFVKAIYSQNPAQHNQIFPIHNLISLMVKISEIQPLFCCTYHKRTREIFYGEAQNTVEVQTEQGLNIEKYLEPIAGVLECVLTSGGDEILVQIDHITRSLTLQSCPCFHIQILKLLKVVLIDSKSQNECASPIEFAQRFLSANGLQILLYLCANNAALDVKAMCIKLIDVLSSHSSLIRMRIDTDLITYLSHVLLPSNMVAKHTAQISSSDRVFETQPKYLYIEGDQNSPQKQSIGLKFFSYQEAVNEDTDQKDNFSEQEVVQSDSFDMDDNLKKQMFSKTMNNFKTRTIQDFETGSNNDDDKQSDKSDEYIPPPPPKTTKNQTGMGFKFGNLADLGSSSEGDSNKDEQALSQDQEQEEEVVKEKEKVEVEMKKPAVVIQKPKGLASLKLLENDIEEFRAPPTRAQHQQRFGDRILGDYDSDNETKKKKDEEAPKPTVDVLMSRNLKSGANKGFNFGGLASDTDSDQQDGKSNSSAKSEEEVKELHKLAPSQTKGNRFYTSEITSGLKLNLVSQDDNQVKLSVPTNKRTSLQSRGLSLNLQIDDDSSHNRLVGTTGATNDIDYDEQPVVQPKKKSFKPSLGLKLDTDKINDLFTFGGEKGEMKEEQAFEKLEDDIKELALICVTAMRKNKPKKENEFQKLLQSPNKVFENKNEQSMLNTNQTVKGIRKIELDNIINRPLSLPNVIEEESDNQNVISQQYTPSTSQLGLTVPYPFPAMSDTQKSQSDEYTGELENLYTSCLEWILSRAPSGLFKTMMIDDYDKITFLPAMQVLMILITHSNNLVRQRALQDMFMLAQWDSQNGLLLLQHKAFHSWLLELLTPYQQECQSDSAKAVFDMGSKLHTLLLKNSCTCPEEEESYKKINLLTRWPAVVAEKGYQVDNANDLSRNLIMNLTNSLSNQQSKQTANNLAHLTLQIHELILTTSNSKQKNTVDQKQSHNESLFQWVLRSYLRYKYDEQEEQFVWADWQLSQALVRSWDMFLIGTKLTKDEEKDSVLLEKSIRSTLFAKSDAEINATVEMLMHVDQYTTTPLAAEQIQSKQTYPQKLLFLGGFNKQSKSQTNKISVTMLQALVNIVCLALTQANAERNQVLLKQWIVRLELYFKYTTIVSELWKSKLTDDQVYAKSQRKMAETCSFILAFLFQEIHTNQTPKNGQVSGVRSDNTPSPQSENLHKSKIFQSCLKSCLIFMINMAGIQQDQPSTKDKLIQIILHQILVKQYSNSSKPLISSQDISRLIESNFEEFPECFQQNDWKIAFFHNSLINGAITAQLNVEMIEGFQQKRILYAVRLKEAEVSTTQANDEILKKIQADTIQAITEVANQIQDSKNQNLLQFEYHRKAQLQQVYQWVKQITGARGAWQSKPAQTFFKLKNQMLGEGQRCLLKDVHSNTFSKLADHSIEKIIFREIYEPKSFLRACDNNRFKYFSSELTKSQLEEIKISSKQIILDLILSQLKPTRKIIIECEQASILHALEKRPGTLIMTNYELIFIYEIVANQSNSTIFFFQWQPTKSLSKQVGLSEVREIQKRRFLGQNKALELFLMNNKSLLIDFKDVEQRDQFAKKLLRQRQNKCKNLIYYTSLDHKWVLKKSNLTEDWVNCKISNFQYLMALNCLASRSYHDLSQYPVFPWVMTLIKSSNIPDLNAISMRGGAPPSQFRDLTKNMQLLGSAERQAEFKRKYEDLEGFIGMNDRFHCGSHYSNPGIVLHYLVRLQPILEANIVLQGNALDNPDRIFKQISQSYQHSLHDFGDVRELTPDFYTTPEMFLNLNHCNFGYQDDGSKVDDVILPEWANKNPYKFVQVMREALESPYVSQNLNSWIDFIFGYKQRDNDAVNSLNTFSKITYQVDLPGDFDITTIQDETARASFENQGYNFGQTPLQLFKEKHPQKLPIQQALKSNLAVDEGSKLKIFKPVPVTQVGPKQTQVTNLISPEAIMSAKFIDNSRIIGAKKEGYAQNFVWLPRAHDQNPSISFSLGSDKKQKFNGRDQDKGMDQVDRSTKKFDYPMTITKDGNYIVKGGFWDGRVVFCPLEGAASPQFELSDHKTTVCVIACDYKEQTIITGTKSGEVIVWRNYNFDCQLEPTSQVNPWVNIKQLNDHDRQVTSIFINDEMCLFVTSSTDGRVNLYNLWEANIIRSISHPNSLQIYSVVLAQSPIPLCTFYSREDHMWHVYSLNGTPLIDTIQDKKIRYEESSHIVQPIVVKSSQMQDKLVYGTERGYICMRNLPSLERYQRLQVSKEYPVLTLLVSPDRRFLLTGCGDGGLIVITERGGQKEQTSQSTSSGYKSTRNSGQGTLNQNVASQSSILSSIQSLVGVGGRQSPAQGRPNQ